MNGHFSSEQMFAALIGDAVSLNGTLDNQQWPQARHQVRMLATRANAAGHPQIREAALNLLTALDAAVRPNAAIWKQKLVDLNTVIDRALDDVERPKTD